MCALKFTAKTIKEKGYLDLTRFAEWIGEEEDIQQNMVEDKVYPMGPECTF